MTTALWDYYSTVYDSLLNFYPYSNLIEDIVEAVQEIDSSNGVFIADLGCGTGNLSIGLINQYGKKIKRIDLVDASEKMLSRAEKKLNPKEKLVETTLCLAGISEFNNKDIKYDFIFLINSFYAMQRSDKIVALRNISNMLSRTGKCVIVDPDQKGSAKLIINHFKNSRGIKKFDPRLIMVGFFDFLISCYSETDGFNFTTINELKNYLADSDLQLNEKPKRVYGGGEGVALMYILEKHDIHPHN